MAEENNAPNENTEAVEPTEVEQLEKQLDELQDRYLRVQAELANIQKRNLKERQDAAKYRSQNLATELLPVIDNIERALEIEVEDEKAVNFKKGVEMVYNLMIEALKNEKIEAINPINEVFDPNFHMSIQVQDAEEGQEPDTVINVVQKGYKLEDRILRPAMVIVAQ
ncbi:nucleotide exchange factor GrpE [Jeotgalibaca porci]|uniref:Protein GrpE n=1 Tax=Jeotgalibaca porci TaxID=1868793 RepID=A0A6G7WJZ7_9LACT|nr:nucleotide exchange factor GrpE [Jeotgalibaca porci]NLB98872.1 nucleotide exchange factor GrpE [Lactobacillales bacterium]QIK52575.1 nucleotide exchange factor GrpE [Jeotgalibaca porci]